MPEICRFDGIVISMFWKDHAPPHFHAVYGEHEAVVSIDPVRLLEGRLPPRQLRQVMRWADRRSMELWVDWERAMTDRPLLRIAPLP
jgi:hypothetical protein